MFCRFCFGFGFGWPKGLLDFYLLGEGFLLVFGELGHRDGEDAVLDLGRDLLAFDVVGEREDLLELCGAELAAQPLASVFLLFLVLLGHLDDKLVVGVDADGEVFFLEAWDAELHLIVFVGLADVHLRGGAMHLGCIAVAPVEKLVEQ